MRHERLKHIADTVCRIFCDWRQPLSQRRLVQLGNGRLVIDVLTGGCVFNGQMIERLPVAAELKSWIEQDLAQYDISKDALSEATLTVDLSLDVIPSELVTPTQFIKYGESIRSGPMHRCQVKCTSVVHTDEAVYRGDLETVERWPVG